MLCWYRVINIGLQLQPPTVFSKTIRVAQIVNILTRGMRYMLDVIMCLICIVSGKAVGNVWRSSLWAVNDGVQWPTADSQTLLVSFYGVRRVVWKYRRQSNNAERHKTFGIKFLPRDAL